MFVSQNIENRNLVLDVMRGMAVIGLLLLKFPGNPSYIYPFLRFTEGGMLADMVYSFFLSAMGISMFYSFFRREGSWDKQLLVKIGKRVLILFALGVLLNLLNMINEKTHRFVLMGELQYIAVAYGLAALLTLWLKRLRFLIGVILVLLVLHYVLFFLFPLPVILRMLSYLVIGLVGYVTATLCHNRVSRLLLSLGLLIVGLSCFLICSMWEQTIPVNATYVLKLMSYSWVGYACLIFLIDVCKWTKWTYPFMVFGRNPLSVYLIAAVLSVLIRQVLECTALSGATTNVSRWFYKNVCVVLFGNNEVGSLCYAFVCALLMWLVAWLLHRRKIFIKI
jgi:predicted acyltransferase